MALPSQNSTMKVGGNSIASQTEGEVLTFPDFSNAGEVIQYRMQLDKSQGPAAVASYDAYLKRTNPALLDTAQAEAETYGSSGYGGAGRANLLLGKNVSEAKLTEEELNALTQSDYQYDPTLEKGAGYQLEGKIEHAGRAADLSYADLQERAIDQTRTDTFGVDAQKGVMSEMESLYNQGGLNEIDRARMAQARAQRRMQARGDRESVMQRMEQMGRAGGNAEMLGQLQANQAAENSMSMDDMQTQALGLERRDSLLHDKATIGGNVQSGMDAIDQFNTLGKRDIEMRRNEAEKAGRLHTYDENASRDRTFTGERNAAHGTQFAEDSSRDTRNADRVTEASRFRVQPGQGRRGMVMDRSNARGITAGARQNVAAGLTGYQGQRDAQKGAQEAALIGLGGTGAEVGGQIASAAASGDDDEEEE